MQLAFVPLAAAAVLALASACGGGDEAASESEPVDPARALPACAGTAPAAADRSALPRDFPLPPGTRITSASTLNETQVLVSGVIPAELQDAASFFTESLPLRGYRVGAGDAEAAEAEAPFTGNGFRGRWRINEIRDCAALRLTLVLIRQS